MKKADPRPWRKTFRVGTREYPRAYECQCTNEEETAWQVDLVTYTTLLKPSKEVGRELLGGWIYGTKSVCRGCLLALAHVVGIDATGKTSNKIEGELKIRWQQGEK